MGSSPVNITDALSGVNRLYIETAPFIYFIERHPAYVDRMREIFRYVHRGSIIAITSIKPVSAKAIV